MKEIPLRIHTTPRILLCRTDRLGDVLLALPCVELLKRMYPGCRLSFLLQPYTAPIPALLPSLDNIIELDSRESLEMLAGSLRDQDFDAAVMLYPDQRLARALKAAGIPLRAGIVYRWYSYLFNYRHREHRKLNLRHEAEYNLNLTYAAFAHEGRWEEVLLPENLFPLKLEIPHYALMNVANVLRTQMAEKLIALHPGGSGSAHRWPLPHYCELARRLQDKTGFSLLVTGRKGEMELCQAVADYSGEETRNLCGRFNLPELAALYQNCSLAITNSTGPLHLARALGTPVLGLFPADKAMSPVRWGPYGLPHNVLTPLAGGAMRDLEVETVFQRAMEILG